MRKILLSLALIMPLSGLAGDRYSVEISVRGMMCEFCAQRVESELTKLGGVISAKVNLEQETAHIECASKQVADLATFRQVLTAAGFSAGDVITPLKDRDVL